MAHCITALETNHDVNGFDCSDPALTIWLQSTAMQHQKKFISKTYVLVNDMTPSVILGFYALSIRKMTPNAVLPLSMAKKLPRDVPGYTLARLAVEQEEQGKGHGETLLINAMKRVRDAAGTVGGVALFVDAKDERAAAFYRKYGFISFLSNPLTLFMPIVSIPK